VAAGPSPRTSASRAGRGGRPLVDYIMTVAVRWRPGDNIISAVPCSTVPRVDQCRVHRRAHRDQPAGRPGSGRAFAVPTYLFVVVCWCWCWSGAADRGRPPARGRARGRSAPIAGPD
jgi:hypothetical protein